MRRRYIWIVAVGIVAVVGLLGYVYRSSIIAALFGPTDSALQTDATRPGSVSVVVSKLVTPWSIVFLPSGDMLVTERSGQMRRIGDDGKIFPVDGVTETSEGGLLGVAIHPDFEANNFVYLYYTTGSSDALTNKVDRFVLGDDTLTFQKTIVSSIPAATNHDGGAIAFGPDRKLYVTTGDASQENLAQDRTSLAGKILRLNDDGSTPADNPFGNLTWSYGHRNPQGIAWDEKGRLWSVEHGPSGAQTGRDELNLIEQGANYGWPLITGDESAEGMRSPVIQSGADETWAPAGMAFESGSLYFAGLRGQAVYKGEIQSDNSVKLSRQLVREYGRLRAVTENNGNLYISTSNRDGRGTPSAEDDKVLRLNLR